MKPENIAYERALDVLRRCVTPLGFKASALPGGYPQVWARDAPITSLGALVSGDPELVNCAKASLETLSGVQTELGMIPLNVDTRTNTVTTENAGAVDANLWFILGHYAHFKATNDLEFLHRQWSKLERALLWLRYQDMNDCGLLEVPEAGDWADLFANRYNILYDNVLYVGALRAMNELASSLGFSGTHYAALSQDVREKINLLMWLDRPWDGHEFGRQLERLKALRLEWFLLYQQTATLTEKPYYLPWTGFREFGDYFDGFGNTAAILLGVADAQRSSSILEYVHAVGADQPFGLKAFYPPIYPGDRDWREYYRSRNLNLPNQYHNGGIWPMLGGFHVAALVHAGQPERAAASLSLLAEANRAGRSQEWEFNEWLHGLSGRAMGHPLQAWSAGMYVYAHHTIKTGQVKLLPTDPR
jgi:GH15 family glucan-1,4-alpha-glucosidase